MIKTLNSARDADARAIARLRSAARPAVERALDASMSVYDRRSALSRFHRLTPDAVMSETPEAARAILREIERALRAERARKGHWSYDLNRHIALLVAHRCESARLARLEAGRDDACAFQDSRLCINSEIRSAGAKGK